MAAGNRAAAAIHRYLQGEEVQWVEPERHVVPLSEVDLRGVLHAARVEHAKQPVAQRARDFAEVEQVLAAEDAISEASRCLNCAVCSECMQCVVACQPQAVNHQMQAEVVDLDVGAIVVATGFDQFQPEIKPEYAYTEHRPQVLSGLEFERLASSSGPTTGDILINGKKPRQVVFIKCIGSRDEAIGNPWCSRVCCMYTAKQAHLIHDRIPDARVTVFYIDVRAFGKGFEEFYDRIREEGITYRRGNVSEIYRRHPDDERLVVRADDTLLGQAVEVEADLVVLATGLTPRSDAETMAGMLGLTRSADGFFQEKQLELFPSDSEQEGVFLAGCCQGPKDVPDTVAHAKSAASSAIVTLSRLRRQRTLVPTSSQNREREASIEVEAHS
jgi:heterodisulfide reductase subunit A